MSLPTNDPQRTFRRNSRSFSLAARFFRPEDQSAVARLYCFCRAMDDLADDTLTGDLHGLDQAIARLSGQAIAPADTIEGDFLALAKERAIPTSPAIELLEALRADCGPQRLQSPADLIRFAYGVAGTVGRMMRYVIHATDPGADAHAIDLGIALQLTNVMRDVAEDARRDRFYLPADWINPATILSALTGDPPSRATLSQALRHTHELAEKYYHSAIQGFTYIPPRNRRVIILATAIYREIGHQVLARGLANPNQRIIVGPASKLLVSLRALAECRQSKFQSPPSRHDSSLHAPLVSRHCESHQAPPTFVSP